MFCMYYSHPRNPRNQRSTLTGFRCTLENENINKKEVKNFFIIYFIQNIFLSYIKKKFFIQF